MAVSDSPRDGRRIATMLAAIVCVAIVAEGAARAGRPWIDRAFRDYFRAVERWPYGERNVSFDRARFKDLYLHPPRGERPLVLLGDSLCQSYGVDDDHSLAGQLRDRLAELGARGVRVHGMAEDGSGLVSQMQTMLALSARLPPTHFVLYLNPLAAGDAGPPGDVDDPWARLRRDGNSAEVRAFYLLSRGGIASWNPDVLETAIGLLLEPRVALLGYSDKIRYIVTRLRARRNLDRGLDLRDVNPLFRGRLSPDGTLAFVRKNEANLWTNRLALVRDLELSRRFARDNVPLLRTAGREAARLGHRFSVAVAPTFLDAIAENEDERRTYARNKAALLAALREGGLTVLETPEIDGAENYYDHHHMLPPGLARVARALAPEIAAWIASAPDGGTGARSVRSD